MKHLNIVTSKFYYLSMEDIIEAFDYNTIIQYQERI